MKKSEMEVCVPCNGSGTIRGKRMTEKIRCPHCHGKGKVLSGTFSKTGSFAKYVENKQKK